MPWSGKSRSCFEVARERNVADGQLAACGRDLLGESVPDASLGRAAGRARADRLIWRTAHLEAVAVEVDVVGGVVPGPGGSAAGGSRAEERDGGIRSCRRCEARRA